MTNTARANWSYMTHREIRIGRWHNLGRGAGITATSVTPHLDLIIRKNAGSRQFDLVARTHTGGDRVVASYGRQMDAKGRADSYATEAMRDYVEAYNARQEAHFAEGMTEAAREGRREFERVVNASGYAEAVARAEALAYQIDAARDVVTADLADAEAEIRAADQVAGELLDAAAGDPAPVEVRDLPGVGDLVEFAPGKGFEDGDVWKIRSVHHDDRGTEFADLDLVYRFGGLGYGSTHTSVPLTRLYRAAEVTRYQAHTAWGRVWAGNSTAEISKAFEGGDYRTAKILADRLVAEQENGTSGVQVTQAQEIDDALNLLRERAPHLLADAVRPVDHLHMAITPSGIAKIRAVAERNRAGLGARDLDTYQATGQRASSPSDAANALAGTMARVLTGAADHRQPLTEFERAAGVVPVERPRTTTYSLCLRVDGAHVGHMAALGDACRDIPADAE